MPADQTRAVGAPPVGSCRAVIRGEPPGHGRGRCFGHSQGQPGGPRRTRVAAVEMTYSGVTSAISVSLGQRLVWIAVADPGWPGTEVGLGWPRCAAGLVPFEGASRASGADVVDGILASCAEGVL
jgi:hypothetical protein